jgi:hypothetical protein
VLCYTVEWSFLSVAHAYACMFVCLVLIMCMCWCNVCVCVCVCARACLLVYAHIYELFVHADRGIPVYQTNLLLFDMAASTFFLKYGHIVFPSGLWLVVFCIFCSVCVCVALCVGSVFVKERELDVHTFTGFTVFILCSTVRLPLLKL